MHASMSFPIGLEEELFFCCETHSCIEIELFTHTCSSRNITYLETGFFGKFLVVLRYFSLANNEKIPL